MNRARLGGAAMVGTEPSLARRAFEGSRPTGGLQLLEGTAQGHSHAGPRLHRTLETPNSGAMRGRGHVLVVGLDSRARAQMLGELHDVLPMGTRFVETDQTWETLTLAESSQMVVLVGDLVGLSGASLVRLLARRQPTLPVLAVAGEAGAASVEAAHR